MSCLVELLYATGLRVSELIALPKSAARTREPMIHVIGKGDKERLVPLSEPAIAAMPRLARPARGARAGQGGGAPGCFPPKARAAISRVRCSRAT